MKPKNLLIRPAMAAGMLLMILLACGEKVTTYQMVLTDFRLNIPAEQLDSYFGKVTDLDVTDQGDIIVVDVAGPGVVRFDPQGNFVNNIAGYGSGNYESLCSANPVDTLLAVHTLGLLEFFRPMGTPGNRHFLRGRGDITVAPDGSFVINRMYDSRLVGYCLETYDPVGKQIATFRTPRATEAGREYLDFAFSRITPDHHIVYVPTTVDSGFIYDFQGNLLLARKIPSSLKPYRLKGDKPGPLVEDLYVDETGIFIVRVNKNLSNEKVVYFDLIEQYDFEFNKIAAYRFAVPLTMTVAPEVYSPWYHKFVHHNGQFYIMMSQPFEQLVVFKPVS